MTNATSAARRPAFPSKLPNVGTTIFTAMSALATEHNAVNLGKAFQTLNAPLNWWNAVTQAMKAGHNQYPPMPGVPVLREAVARKIEALHGRGLQPQHGNHHHRGCHAGHHHRHPGRGAPWRRGDRARPLLRQLRAQH